MDSCRLSRWRAPWPNASRPQARTAHSLSGGRLSMSATSDTIAIRQHFADNWNAENPLVYANQPPAEIDSGAVWARFSVRLGETFHGSGSAQSGVLISQGRAWLQTFTPQGQGDAAALDLIDHFVTIFQHRRLDDNAIRFSTADRDLDPTSDGGYAMATVSIPFESFRRYA